jgi:glycosyltransferase involved in cell wall biosynthesis
LTAILQPSDEHSNHPRVGKQRLLVLSSLFPPDVLGGAEMSAYNLAAWLRDKGFEVGVLTTAKTPEEACEAVEIDGMKVWRVWMPRLYPMFFFARAKAWQKPLWHLQDHFDPRNRKIVARILREFKPDFVNIHLLQGIGYNALKEIARCGVPTTFFLHDLGLACFRMSMFRKGKACEKQCLLCNMSSLYKRHCARQLPALEFVSPSQANLDILAKYFPVGQWHNAVIMNANKYPVPTVTRRESATVRLLCVGRLHVTKGIELLLQVVGDLAAKYDFTMTIVGSGPDEASLREKYGRFSWCRFTGFVTQEEVSNAMVNSDVLCVPSVWAENSPGVVIHALGLGLPVVGSDKAGIPELVEDRKNGLLVPPGDLQAWATALSSILENPLILKPWRAYALENAYKFDQDYIGERLLRFLSLTL